MDFAQEKLIVLYCIVLSTSLQAKLASLPRLNVPKKPTGLSSPTGFVKLCESSDRDAASREDLTKLAKDANGLLKVGCSKRSPSRNKNLGVESVLNFGVTRNYYISVFFYLTSRAFTRGRELA